MLKKPKISGQNKQLAVSKLSPIVTEKESLWGFKWQSSCRSSVRFMVHSSSCLLWENCKFWDYKCL